MKSMIKFFGVIAIVAVIGFSMAGCKEDETDPTPETVTYQGTADGVTYTLKITENTARYTAQSGDSYELTVGTKKSTGTVEKNEGGKLTLKPSRGTATFTATVGSSGISAMSGTITCDKEADGTLPAPETLTPPAPPVTGNDPFAGTWDAPFNEPPPDVQRIIAANRSYSQYAVMNGPPEDPREWIRGTYTVSGNTVTLTGVSFNMKVFQDSYDVSKAEWVTWANLDSDWKTNLGGSPTYSITITGNSFTNTNWNMTFTKK
jgi:hypothetical protein